MDLKKLYSILNDESKSGNPFYTTENEALFLQFCQKHLGETGEYDEKFDKAWEDLGTLLYEENKNAFIVGYKTALSLILAGSL